MIELRQGAAYLAALFGMLTLCSCAAPLQYLKEKINPDEPATLIGYQTMDVRAGTPPEVIIDFETNSWTLTDQAHALIDAMISDDRSYLVEGTAGGFTGSALTLSRKRTNAVIGYLETQGIQPKRIFIVNYDPQQAERQVRVYTITR